MPAALEAGAAALERRLAAEGYVEPRRRAGGGLRRRASSPSRSSTASRPGSGRASPSRSSTATRLRSRRRSSQKRMKLERGRRVPRGEGPGRRREAAEVPPLSRAASGASVELIAAEPTEDGRIRPVYRIAVGPLFELRGDRDQGEGGAQADPRPARGAALRRGPPGAVGDRPARRAAALRALPCEGLGDRRRDRSGRRHGSRSSPGRNTPSRRSTIAGDASVSGRDAPQSHGDAAEGPAARRKGPPDRRGSRAGDVSTILGYYQTRGWIDAQVTPKVTDGPEPDEPGRRGSTSRRAPARSSPSAGWRAPSTCSPRTSTALLTVKVGEPFNPRRRAPATSATLTSRYRNTGWAEATVQDNYTLSEDRTKVDVEYRVDEGERSFFGKHDHPRQRRDRGRADPQARSPGRKASPSRRRRSPTRSRTWRARGSSARSRSGPSPPIRTNQTRNIDVEAGRSAAAVAPVRLRIPVRRRRRRQPQRRLRHRRPDLPQSLRADAVGLARGAVRADFDPRLPLRAVPRSLRLQLRRSPSASSVSRAACRSRTSTSTATAASSRRSARGGSTCGSACVTSTRCRGRRTRRTSRRSRSSSFPKTAFPIKQSAIGPSFFYDRRDDILDPHAGWYATLAGKYAFPFAVGRRAVRQGLGPGGLVQEHLRRRARGLVQDGRDLPVRPRGL